VLSCYIKHQASELSQTQLLGTCAGTYSTLPLTILQDTIGAIILLPLSLMASQTEDVQSGEPLLPSDGGAFECWFSEFYGTQ
jgi:hypothetical protein